MTSRTASLLRRYAVPTVAVTAAFGLTLPLRGDASHLAYPLLLSIIAGSGFVGGWRVGVLATAGAFLALVYDPAAGAGPLENSATWAFAFAGLLLSALLGVRARIEAERDDLQAAVSIERERLEAVLDSSHIGIGFLDASLRFLQVNEALAVINGLPAREHLGRRVHEVAPWISDTVVGTLHDVLEGRSGNGIGIGIPSDDTRFNPDACHFLGSFLPLRGPDGAVMGVGFTVSDVTELRESEAEQARLRVKAEGAQRAADAANHMKDEFLMTLSHEMRSPLQAILGWGLLLRGGQLDAKQADQAFETIERIVRQQAELLNGLFDVSLILAGKMEIDRAPVDLAELVRQAFEDKQFSARRHGITMVCDAATAVPVLGDSERIHQVLGNLLTNAIKFTPTGGRVELRCRTANHEGVITVRDTGEGVPPEFIQHIFERFSQADRSRERRHRGLGLGLSIVYHLVELHGGHVEAVSPGEGGGTTMTVRLPLATAAPSIEVAPRSVVVGPQAAFAARRLLTGIRVLIVEDDVNVRESTAAFLEMRAAHVTTAASASEGIEAFLDAKPDVVVSDLGLPDEDGYSFLRRLRELEGGRDVPVLAFSGYSSAAEHTRCLEAGFALHLVKPVDPELLVRALAAAVVRVPGVA